MPKDAWEWALVERLGPGEVAPLEADARVLADAKQPSPQPWTTILLLGTDEGPGNLGARTDTIILAAIQHGTGRAAAFGVPRNLAQVPLGPKGTPFKEPINALYGRSGGGETGARNLKQAVSALLGIRVDYYALVNLVGFADLVDALGGVEIVVKERLRDEVTRPAWGEPKPRIDVAPASAAASTAARRSPTSARARTRATTRGWRGSAASSARWPTSSTPSARSATSARWRRRSRRTSAPTSRSTGCRRSSAS